ncbi:DUF3828 domain-containing protein [Runella sp. SP2]|uniref:DUF3828 domain-containing protein n=1 Tax=Runella sp. SP2 TaxID=2268026 RepID=UPI000F08CFE6|nr:DUF3828 domain-containing protein [Runella sp. SP2]AYQ31636.1 DUF3828 domain-containing protein [Runella sp. SP2]
MRKLLLLFFTFSYFVVASYGQTKTASQTVQDFYKWYTTKGAILEWRQVVKRPELSPAFRKRLTIFYQKMEKDNEGGYDPIVQAQDFDDQFKIKALSSSTTKATFELWMFGGKAATVTLNNVANQWLIDDIKGV